MHSLVFIKDGMTEEILRKLMENLKLSNLCLKNVWIQQIV